MESANEKAEQEALLRGVEPGPLGPGGALPRLLMRLSPVCHQGFPR